MAPRVNLDDWVNQRLGRSRGTRVTDKDRRRAGLALHNGRWVQASRPGRENERPAPGRRPTRAPTKDEEARVFGGALRGEDAGDRPEPRPRTRPQAGNPRRKGKDNRPFPSRPTYAGNNVPWGYEHTGAYDLPNTEETEKAEDVATTTEAEQDSYFYNALYVRGGPFAAQSPGNGEISAPSKAPQRINIATFVNGVKRMTKNELVMFQRDLVDLGLLNPGDFDWGVLGGSTQQAAEKFFLEARSAGMSIQDYAATGGPDAGEIDELTGGQDVDVSDQEISLSNPDSIINMGQQVAQNLLGRDLTDEEKLSLVDSVHQGERASQTASIMGTANAQAAQPASGQTSTGGTVPTGSETDRFLLAIMGRESGGDVDIQNVDSGAYGLFQFMPATWNAWARRAGVDPADKSAGNQWKVARAMATYYYSQYGNWRDVAVIWYSGDANKRHDDRPQGGGKYPSINDYADEVVGRMSSNTGTNPDGSTQGGQVTGQPFENTQAPDASTEAERLLKEKDPKGWAAHRVWSQFDQFSSMIGEL